MGNRGFPIQFGHLWKEYQNIYEKSNRLRIKYCWSTEGGTLFIGDLPPSTTEDWVKFLVGDLGAFSYLKVPSCPTP